MCVHACQKSRLGSTILLQWCALLHMQGSWIRVICRVLEQGCVTITCTSTLYTRRPLAQQSLTWRRTSLAGPLNFLQETSYAPSATGLSLRSDSSRTRNSMRDTQAAKAFMCTFLSGRPSLILEAQFAALWHPSHIFLEVVSIASRVALSRTNFSSAGRPYLQFKFNLVL